jgi:superfamily II DNA or RNA helicase
VKIEIVDNTYCKTDEPKALKEFLTVKKMFMKRNPITQRKEKVYYDSPLVDKKGFFLSGFLERVLNQCKLRQIDVELSGSFETLKYGAIEYPNLTLYPDQQKLVEIALKVQRGIIKAPTGTGKTVVTYAIIKPCMPCKALIICPSQSIMSQTAEKFQKEFGMKTSIAGDGTCDLSGDVVVGLINTLHRIPASTHSDLFDIVIVDEAHHVGLEGMYSNFLSHSLAPIRIGVTATPNAQKSENAMGAEGYLGPIIGTFEFADAVKAKRIAKPILKLIPVPINSNISHFSRYAEIYEIGVVYNRLRNQLVVKCVKEQIEQNKSTLIFVKFLNHADILQEMLTKEEIVCETVRGSINDKERSRIKNQISKKELMCVIATAAWKEGVDIPTLDTVINAAGYLSEKPVIQMAGRALRVADGKEDGTIIDFLDSGMFLANHCVKRLLVYSEKGWL